MARIFKFLAKDNLTHERDEGGTLMEFDHKNNCFEELRNSLISQIDRAIAMIESGGGTSSLAAAKIILNSTSESSASVINNCHVADEKLNSVAKGPANLIKAAISVIYAQRLLNSNKPLEAMRTLNDAYYFLGATATITLEVVREKRKKSAAGTKAVTVRHAKNTPLKNKIIELLGKEKPSKGWPSISNAAKKLADPLISFMKDKSFGVSEHNIEVTTIKWIRKEGSPLRQAFKDNASDAALRRLND